MQLSKKQTIVFGIIIGILGYFAGIGVYGNYFKDKEPVNNAQKINTEGTSEPDSFKLENSFSNFFLDDCLEGVDKRFGDFADQNPTLSTEEVKIFLETRQNEIDNCYKRYPVE